MIPFCINSIAYVKKHSVFKILKRHNFYSLVVIMHQLRFDVSGEESVHSQKQMGPNQLSITKLAF